MTALPPGEGRIEGQVRDAEGGPVAGVTIRATLQRGPGIRRPSLRLKYEEEVLEEVQRLLAGRQRIEAVTDAAGRYAIQGLPESALFTLRACADGMEVVPAIYRKQYVSPAGLDPLEQADVRPGEVVDFLAWVVVDLPLRIALDGGEAPDHAQIFYRVTGSGDNWYLQMWYPDSQTIRLYPGTYDLRARLGPDHGLKSETAQATVVAGTRPEPVTLDLRERSGIAGRLIFPQGEAPERAYVAILRIQPGQEVDGERLWKQGKSSEVTPTKGFQFRFGDLPPGTYFVGLSRYSFELLASAELQVEESMVTQDFEVPPLRRGEYLVLTVLDPRGEPLDGVSIQMGLRESSGSGAAMRRSAGFYWVPYPRPPSVVEPSPAEYFMRVTSPRYGSRELTLSAETAEATVQFEEAADLEVTIAGYAQSGLAGLLEVWLHQRSGEGPRTGLTRVDAGLDIFIDASGIKSFTALVPGEYAVEIVVKGTDGAWRPALRQPLTLRSGQNRFQAQVPKTHTLTLVLGPASAGRALHLSSPGGEDGWRGTVDSNGRAVFKPLPAGVYHIQGPGGSMEVELAADLEMPFAPASPGEVPAGAPDPKSRRGR